MDTSAIVGKLRDFFRDTPPDVVAAYLFGSVARGDAGPDSDVDVAVLYARPPAPTLAGLPLDLQDALEERLGHRVQIVVLNTAPVDLAHRVLRDGLLLADPDPRSRIRFEVRVRNEFFDLEPVLRRYRKTESLRPAG